jgi:hypothetical protein
MKGRPRQSLDPNAKLFHEGVQDLKRLIEEGDDSDASWQDDLPEAPEIPEDADDTVVVVIPKR